MIIVSLHCQMGNQMFQYAFAHCQSKRLRTFFLPYTSNSFYPFKLQYFKLNPIVHWLYDNSEITRQFRRLCRKLIQYICKDKVLGNERIIDITLKNSAYYEGFFQSDAYFKDNIHLVFEGFRIKGKYRKAFTQKYGDFFAKNKVIVIHFRRKDYNDVKIPELSEAGISLPIDYYRKSLSMIENIEHYKILFIGDDLESVERDFGNNPSHIYNSKIGRYSYVSINAYISLTNIGSFCSIGPNFLCGWGIHPVNTVNTSPMFYSTLKQNGTTMSLTDKLEERKNINIGNDVFIGANVTVLDGVSIGDGSIVGAGTIVSKDVPPYAVVVGSPMKIIKYRFDDEQIEKLSKIRWWEFDDEKLKKVEKYFFDVEEFIKNVI